jgi:PAP2 superfamily
LRLWREAVYILGVYLVYSTVRNQFGSAGGPLGQSNRIAFDHAEDVIDVERHLHLLFEPAFQRWYLDLPGHGFIQFWNVFYGTAHFIVTAVALVWLFLSDPERYPRLRNTLMFTTVLALVGFASFSLMPPRLLTESPDRFGPPAGSVQPRAAFVDTLASYKTFWSFDSGTVKSLSNQYAAMPSMHIGWSTWSAIVLIPMVRRKWLKALIGLHPVATFLCIVVTANHYWLDAMGGLITLGTGALLAWLWAAYLERRRASLMEVSSRYG